VVAYPGRRPSMTGTGPASHTLPVGHPTAIVAVSGVTKTFTSPDGSPLAVLDDISLDLHEGEIVALLGRSGSGKSTLLRCIAGLIAPTSGQVFYRGTPLAGANPGVAMVFQSFALLPWLTVRQNVEIGLEARGVEPVERRRRAEETIDRIGLDGFEQAYPKELSGGMRQRVGFARALVVEPDALLMDEPFSALDVLTAQHLRTELLRLWNAPGFPTKAMLIVTHNIEEAVTLADRIFVLGANPGRIRTEIHVPFPQPRDRQGEAFQALVDEIYGLMTGRAEGPPSHVWTAQPAIDSSPTETPLPEATVGGMSGLLEILAARGGREDLPKLAHGLTFEVDDLLPLVDAAQMLGLAVVDHGDLEITEEGRAFVEADILESKKIFAARAKERAPLVRAICTCLESTKDGTLGEGFFLDLLRRGFSEEEAREQLHIAIDWGRYGELFDFDANTGQLRLESQATDASP
jgi:NitT/TauT family transport system ATP-binding protein